MGAADVTGLPQKAATEAIATQHRQVLSSLPFQDEQDFQDARRGFVAALEPGIVHADGRVVWDNDSYGFLTGEAPPTVHPSLWRQSTLTAIQGLFEVAQGIYQVRGMDLSNVSFIEGDRGVIVLDPLISAETAAAALALYRQHRGDRPVTGVIYTHSHADHFGGVRGVVDQEDVDAGTVPILAPAGFLESAVSENVYAGTAMGRRAGYMYGAALPRGPRGQVGAGLGQTTSTGTFGIIAPTLDVSTTGQEESVDGVRMVFQMAPGSEAPAEMHVYFPPRRALCVAENATHVLHNILTLRGAQVRDPHAWAGYLTEAIDLFSADLELVFASHHWPTWGRERAVEFLALQRDLYAYLHDQTLRMLNQGLTGAEIAEAMVLPPALEQAWHARGYYGSVSHNVKAIYQRYMGWYDGNPAHLWPHPPQAAARRYVEFMGGADTVVAKAWDSFGAGDFRWAAEVLNHVVFAEPGHAAARELLADTYEQLGYGAENGTWRCAYLSGATELRFGNFGTPVTPVSPDVLTQLTPEQLFDALAIRVNGPRCWHERVTLDVDLTDIGTRYRLTLRNGVLTYTSAPQRTPADAVLRLPATGLAALATGGNAVAGAGLTVDGDAAVLGRLLAALDAPDLTSTSSHRDSTVSRPVDEVNAPQMDLRVAAAVVDVFVYVVVLNLYIEYLPSALTETFTLSLLTAVLLKAVLEVVVVVKNRVKVRFRKASTSIGKAAAAALLWVVLVGSKFVVLEAVDLVFGARVSLGGFVSVTLLIISLLLARLAVRRLLRAPRTPAAELRR